MADKLQGILESLEQGVQDFFTSDKFTAYLDVMSRFHNYSLNNQILIARQMPDATWVAGYNSWLKNFDRHVKRGEKGISILAPQKHKVEVEVKNDDGSTEVKKLEKISFRPVSVFDVSQTEGKELPQLVTELNGEVKDYDMYMEAISIAAPFHINIQEVSSEAKGWCDMVSENIVIKAGMSELQTIKTAIHETAHARIHHIKDDKDRGRKEVEAEGCAYTVCKHFGLDTSDYSFGYVAGWSLGKSSEELKAAIKTIHDEAKDIISIIEGHILERTREVDGLTPAAIEKAAKDEVGYVLQDMSGFESEALKARFYGSYKLPDEPRVAKVMVEYTGNDREDDVFNALHDNPVKVNGMELDINPIRADKSGDIKTYYRNVRKYERDEMEDDTWPMITVTYSSYDEIPAGTSMNIYEAVNMINKADEELMEAGKRENYLKVNLAYTFCGRKEEKVDTINLGEGQRNIIDYLSVPVPVATYMKRHYQVLDTLKTARDSVSRRSFVGEMYEDTMLEWAEEARRELNYNMEPEITQPPELKKEVNLFKEWEMIR